MPLWQKRRTHLYRKQEIAGSYPAGGTGAEKHRISAGSKPAKQSVLETDVCGFESRPVDFRTLVRIIKEMPLWRKRRTQLPSKQEIAGSYPAGGTGAEKHRNLSQRIRNGSEAAP